MKSITVTTLRSINFGAVLQSYALHVAQKKLGVDNRVLDKEPLKNMYERISLKFNKRMMISLISNIFYFFHHCRTKRCLKKFDQFVKDNIKTTRKYNGINELRHNPPKADFFINGSDQVFGLRGQFDQERMIQFGAESIKRYSYAASLGEYDWNDDEKKRFSKLLHGFNKISVREKYAKEYIESFCDIKCETNIDPVFLLDREEWDNLAAERLVKEDYILCYPLLGNSNLQVVLDELKKKTGLKIVSVQVLPLKRVKADVYFFDAGPKEFLSLIKYSTMVVTTSFHGTAFSLIYEKPFVTLTKEYKSQRMTDLLGATGLSHRIYKKGMTLDTSELDFSICRKYISGEKERGFNYLKNIVKDVCSNIG